MNPVGTIAQKPIGLTSGSPTATNAGSDTALTFTATVNHLLVQNNTSANCYVEVEAVASTSSLALAPGAVWEKDIEVLSLHIYTAAVQNINAANGIVVKGWL